MKTTVSVLTNGNQLAHYPHSSITEVVAFLTKKGLTEIISGIPNEKQFKRI